MPGVWNLRRDAAASCSSCTVFTFHESPWPVCCHCRPPLCLRFPGWRFSVPSAPCQIVHAPSASLPDLFGFGGESHVTQSSGTSTGNQSADEFERCTRRAHHQVTQGLPHDRHHAELRVVQVTTDGQFGDLAIAVFKQGNRQANRQIQSMALSTFSTKVIARPPLCSRPSTGPW